MTRKLLSCLVAAALAALLVGTPSCTSTDCTGFCQQEQSCGAFGAVSCDQFCIDVQAMVDTSSCDDSFDELVSCFQSLTDVCSQTDHCLPQGATFDGCWKPYCNVNPTDPGCQALVAATASTP